MGLQAGQTELAHNNRFERSRGDGLWTLRGGAPFIRIAAAHRISSCSMRETTQSNLPVVTAALQ
jgi:hypothetical protein